MNYYYFLHPSIKNSLQLKDYLPREVNVSFRHAFESTPKTFWVCMEVCTCNSMLHMTKLENRVRNSKVSNQCLLYTLSINAINIGKLQ